MNPALIWFMLMPIQTQQSTPKILDMTIEQAKQVILSCQNQVMTISIICVILALLFGIFLSLYIHKNGLISKRCKRR